MPSNTTPYVLIDLSWIAYRAMHTMRDLSFDDMPTGVLYGFFEQLLYVCTHPKIMSNKVLVFADSRKSYRKRIYPGYKYNRHDDRTPEEIQAARVMGEQVGMLRKTILPKIGLPVYQQTGLESDDLIADACLQIYQENPGSKAGVIITSDGDLYQCINTAIHWFDPSRDLYLNELEFWAKKGVDACHWPMVKAMAGCHSDTVPGIPGVGEKTAIDFINGILPKTYKKYGDISSREGIQVRERNLRLVRLPFEKTKPVTMRLPEYNTDAFFQFADEFGFASYLTPGKRREWGAFFRGEMGFDHRPARRRGEKR